MKKWLLLGIPLVTVVMVACSSTVTPVSDAGATNADAAPSTTTTTTSTGTGTSPPVDAAVPLPPPATVTLSTGTCTEAVPCGGAVEGTWDYSAACVSTSSLAGLTAQLQKACPSATVAATGGTLAGRITFAGSSVTRKGTLSLKADLGLPGTCTAPAGGNCSLVAASIKGSAPEVTSISCTTATDGCTCKVELTADIDKANTTFTTSGSKLVTSDGDEYEYCVQGKKLTHKLTTSSNATHNEPGDYEATKR